MPIFGFAVAEVEPMCPAGWAFRSIVLGSGIARTVDIVRLVGM